MTNTNTTNIRHFLKVTETTTHTIEVVIESPDGNLTSGFDQIDEACEIARKRAEARDFTRSSAPKLSRVMWDFAAADR